MERQGNSRGGYYRLSFLGDITSIFVMWFTIFRRLIASARLAMKLIAGMMLLIVLAGCQVSDSSGIAGNDYNAVQIARFLDSKAVNPIRFAGDPYRIPGNREQEQSSSLPQSVCAVRYIDEARTSYKLLTYPSAQAAVDAGDFVTHTSACGTCSTLRDLAVYLRRPNLTEPVRRCAMLGMVRPLAMSCLMEIGFTEACAETWYYNAKQTAKACGLICLKSWLRGSPFNHLDGSLNSCLACDERVSGPVFKAVAGRTRRNSGITTAIQRPADEIEKLDHNY